MNDIQPTDIVRAITIVVLATACGAMIRYYLGQPKMPKMAFLAYGCWAIVCFSVTIGNFEQPWRWFESPFILAGALVTIVGIWPHMVRKKL